MERADVQQGVPAQREGVVCIRNFDSMAGLVSVVRGIPELEMSQRFRQRARAGSTQGSFASEMRIAISMQRESAGKSKLYPRDALGVWQ